jgi:hypothetical protein
MAEGEGDGWRIDQVILLPPQEKGGRKKDKRVFRIKVERAKRARVRDETIWDPHREGWGGGNRPPPQHSNNDGARVVVGQLAERIKSQKTHYVKTPLPC